MILGNWCLVLVWDLVLGAWNFPTRHCDSNGGAGFGLFPFRSPLLRESLLISFPLLLRCFSSQSDLPLRDLGT